MRSRYRGILKIKESPKEINQKAQEFQFKWIKLAFIRSKENLPFKSTTTKSQIQYPKISIKTLPQINKDQRIYHFKNKHLICIFQP